MSISYTYVNSDFTCNQGWAGYLIDCSSNNVTCTIPDMDVNIGECDYVYFTRIDSNGSNTCTLNTLGTPTGHNFINGLTSLTLPPMIGTSTNHSIKFIVYNNTGY